MGLDVQFFTVTGTDVEETSSLAQYIDLNDDNHRSWANSPMSDGCRRSC